MPTEAEIAWAAGLFEGEGCARTRGDLRTRGDYLSPYVALRMCDEEPVRQFAAIVGFGHVNRRKNGSGLPHHRDLWCWESGSKRDVPKLAVLLPWLSPRRRAAVQAAIDACTLMSTEERSQRIREGQASEPRYQCACGKGPMPKRGLARHHTVCKEVMPSGMRSVLVAP